MLHSSKPGAVCDRLLNQTNDHTRRNGSVSHQKYKPKLIFQVDCSCAPLVLAISKHKQLVSLSHREVYGTEQHQLRKLMCRKQEPAGAQDCNKLVHLRTSAIPLRF